MNPGGGLANLTCEWTFDRVDGILKKFETGKNITTSCKSSLNVASIIAKFGCKML